MGEGPGRCRRRRFDAAGQPVSPEVQVNVSEVGGHGAPAVGTAPDGRTAIAWIATGDDGYFRQFDAAMAPISAGDEDVDPGNDGAAPNDVAADAERFTIVWEADAPPGPNELDVNARRFS